MKIRDVMTENVETISADATLKDAAKKMEQKDIGLLPVFERGRLAGVVTDRDITVRAVARGLDPKITPVREAMTPRAASCDADADVSECAEIMEERQIRRLIVRDHEHHAVGIVSLGDLALHTGNEELISEVLERVSEPILRQ